MRRGGQLFGLALLLALPASYAWALSPALSAALDNLLNAQLIASLESDNAGGITIDRRTTLPIKYRSDFDSDDQYRSWLDEQVAANNASIHPDYFNAPVDMPSDWWDRNKELNELGQLWTYESELSEPDPLDHPEGERLATNDYRNYVT
jgi:hypothetical protein